MALVETVTNVVAYIGETAILPSGAKPSWTLSQIDWSIYRNITNIATYQLGVKNVELFGQFHGRLDLNHASGKRLIPHLKSVSECEHNWPNFNSASATSFCSSGDLKIRNVKPDDAMEYSVDLISTIGLDSVNKVNLIVRSKCHLGSSQALLLSANLLMGKNTFAGLPK